MRVTEVVIELSEMNEDAFEKKKDLVDSLNLYFYIIFMFYKHKSQFF